MVQAGERLPGVDIAGVDLVDQFDQPNTPNVHLIGAPLHDWSPHGSYDLITCVHGLHYIGDKLWLLTRAASWLTVSGRFVADLDLASVRVEGLTERQLVVTVRQAGLEYDSRRHRVSRMGRASVTLPYLYLGADDRGGPNYTGQPAVDSYYARST